MYRMWMNAKDDWERDHHGRPLLITEEHATMAIRNKDWTQVRFIPEERADTFESDMRARIEREELSASEYNQRLIQTYAGGTNPLD